jgi:hypothetical protein
MLAKNRKSGTKQGKKANGEAKSNIQKCGRAVKKRGEGAESESKKSKRVKRPSGSGKPRAKAGARGEQVGAAGLAEVERPKKLARPGVTYRKRAAGIAWELAGRAEAGSYLHARELRQMAVLDDLRKTKGRRSSGLVKVLLARLDEMTAQAEHGVGDREARSGGG